MTTTNTPPQAAGPRPGAPSEKGGQGRDARLKAALKANLARRKAQARARRKDTPDKDTPDKEGTPGHG